MIEKPMYPIEVAVRAHDENVDPPRDVRFLASQAGGPLGSLASFTRAAIVGGPSACEGAGRGRAHAEGAA